MATFYVRTAGGNSNAAATYSNTGSGGAAASSVPTAADDIILEAGSGQFTINAALVCRSFDCTSGTGSYTNTLTIASGIVCTVGHSTSGPSNIAVRLSSGMTVSLGNSASGFTFVGTSGVEQSVICNGKSVGAFIVNNTSAILGWGGAIVAATWTVNAGTFRTNNNSATLGAFNFGNATTRTIDFGSSVITCTNTSSAFTGSGTTGLTVPANTATIVCTGAVVSQNNIIILSNYNWNGLSVTISGGGQANISPGGTSARLANLTITGTANKNNVYQLVTDLTITGVLTLSSNSDVNNMMIASSVRGAARTISAASVVVNNRVDFMDITGAGAATWTVAGTGASFLGDAGGNSGITFTTPATQTISSGAWDVAGNWTSRIPLPQDNVIIIGSGSVTLNQQRIGKDIDMSAFTGTLTLVSSSFTYDFFGSVILGSGMSWGANPNTFNFNASGRGSHTITSNGKLFFPAGSNQIFSINGPGGTYTLADAISQRTPVSASFTILAGNFVTNNYSCEFGRITSTGALTRSVTWGTSLVSLYVTSAVGFITLVATGLTWSGSNATFTVVNASANARSLDLAGASIGTFDYSVSGSTGTLTFVSGVVNVMKFSDTANARTLSLSGTGAVYINDWSQVFGRSGAPITVSSSSAGTRRTLGSYGATQQTLDYATVQDLQFVSGNKLFVTNGTDGGNNRNITFGAPSGGIFQKQQEAALSGSPVTSLSATFPVPVAAGKVLLCILGWSGNPSTVTLAGWTLVRAWNRTITGSGAPYGAIYMKIADGSETTVSPTWLSSAVPTIAIQELDGFAGIPTIDTVTDANDSASATSLSTSNSGAGVTPTAVPAYAIAAVAGNGGMGATTTPATNNFADNYEPILQASGTVLHTASKYMSASSAQSTVQTWTTARVPAAALAFIYDVPNPNAFNFLMFM